jgi:hypothetical protein
VQFVHTAGVRAAQAKGFCHMSERKRRVRIDLGDAAAPAVFANDSPASDRLVGAEDICAFWHGKVTKKLVKRIYYEAEHTDIPIYPHPTSKRLIASKKKLLQYHDDLTSGRLASRHKPPRK